MYKNNSNDNMIIFVFFQEEWILRKSSDMLQFIFTEISTDSERTG